MNSPLHLNVMICRNGNTNTYLLKVTDRVKCSVTVWGAFLFYFLTFPSQGTFLRPYIEDTISGKIAPDQHPAPEVYPQILLILV